MSVLGLEAVRFAYGSHEALRGVTLVLEGGERVALLGPNGAGKSTLLRIASGFLVPSAGTVRLGGRDLAEVSRREAARRVAGVAADEAHDFPFRVRESVALGRHAWRSAFGPPSRDDHEHVGRALTTCDLEGLADRLLPSLSSGERQRVALARALAQAPEVLLLDEPTAHLDLGHQLRVLDAVSEVARVRGTAVLAALHDVNLAASWADRVVLLVAGQVEAVGAPGDVLRPDRLEAAFGAPVHVLAHPDGGRPLIAPRRRP